MTIAHRGQDELGDKLTVLKIATYACVTFADKHQWNQETFLHQFLIKRYLNFNVDEKKKTKKNSIYILTNTWNGTVLLHGMDSSRTREGILQQSRIIIQVKRAVVRLAT